MADNLEIRLGGIVGGRPVTTSDIDFSEIRPLIDKLESAALIEAGIDVTAKAERRTGGAPRPLTPVRLALAHAFTPVNELEAGAIYHFVVGAQTAEAVARITAGLAGRPGVYLLPGTVEAVRKALSRTINRGLSVQLVNGVKTPVFDNKNPPPKLTVHPTRRFDTQIAVRILRVGGKQPLARVQLLGSGQEATVELRSEKRARELGQHLYRDAILKGSSEWVIDPNRFSAPTRLVEFVVSGYRLLKPTTTDTVIDEMTKATGGVWDDVDPTNPEQVDDAPGGTGDLSG
jgi:hypothetical protein